ncbi:MAG TPA: hypothetical protein VNM48_03380, partial [Chloroflexota bacterium]|nr:hypothetical protein [Chloroflexota bacterium]
EDEKAFLRELQTAAPVLYRQVKAGEITVAQAQDKLLTRQNGLSKAARQIAKSAPEPVSSVPTPEAPSIGAASHMGGSADGDVQDSQKEEDEDEWLEKLPLWLVLRGLVHRGYAVRDDLLAWRAMEEAGVWTRFAHHSTRLCALEGQTPFLRAVAGVAYLPRPQDWKVCSPCQGEGCESCTYAGYDPRTGIDPARMLSGPADGGES